MMHLFRVAFAPKTTTHYAGEPEKFCLCVEKENPQRQSFRRVANRYRQQTDYIQANFGGYRINNSYNWWHNENLVSINYAYFTFLNVALEKRQTLCYSV